MNKILFGIKNVHVAKLTEINGVISYGTPFPVRGAVGLGMDPESGEAVKFHADNIVFYKAPESNQGYKGDLELAITPLEFLKQILGRIEDTNGVLFESADDVNSRFALLFQAEGDENNRRFCFYDCTATRPSRENNTKEETISPGTEKLSISMDPRSTDRVVMSSVENTDDTSEIYENWFSSVYEKDQESA